MLKDAARLDGVISGGTGPDIHELLSGVKDIPPLPNIVARAMEIAHDPNGSVRELQILIAKDQALSAKILRIVNSAMYALRCEISTVSHAISVLGIDTVFSVIMASSVENVFQSAKSLGTKLLSEHSWGTAIAARSISKRIHYEMPEEALVCGLMHDIGKPVLMQNFRALYAEIAGDAYKGVSNFHEAELTAFGFSHAHVGALLARKWNFPPQLEEAVGHHHDPVSAPKFRKLACIVNLANAFMISMEIGFEKNKELKLESLPAAEELGLGEAALQSIKAETKSTIEATSRMGN
ncbi:MAG: HDOD domain-containing protein [Acidobacteria bacterium]|nr:HDOD domain-containing protein [Acidobacteriota bacterium]